MAGPLAPEDIQIPGVAPDRGVQARPTAALGTTVQDPTGNSMQGLSQELNQTADMFRKLAIEKQTSEDKSFVDRYHLELAKRYTPLEQDALTSPDTANPNFVTIFDKRLQDTQREVYDQVAKDLNYTPSRDGRDAASHVAMQLRTASAQRTAVAVHNQRVGGLVDNATRNIISLSQIGAANGDLVGTLERVDATVNTVSGAMAPDKLRDYRRAAREQAVSSTVRGYIDRNQFPEARMLVDRNRGFAANSMERFVAESATAIGEDPAYLVAAARVESSMNPNAKTAINPATGQPFSTASGLFGFTRGTGTGYGLPADASTASPREQADAAAKLTRDNRAELKTAMGRDPTYGELYLAHFLGAKGAKNVLLANGNAPVEDLVSSDAIKANPNILKGKTASEVVGWASAKMVASGSGEIGNYLPESERIQLMNMIETRQKHLSDEAEKAQKKILDETGEVYLKEAFKRSSEGTLKPDFVESIKTFIKPTEYKGLLAASTGDDANVDDPTTIVNLTKVVDEMTPDEFMGEATKAIEKKNLKTSTFMALVNRNRTARKDDAPTSPFRSGRDLVKGTLEVGQLVSGPAAQIGHASQNNAIVEYDLWAEANPKASRAEALAEAGNIINRYQIIPFEQIKLSVPSSRYFGSKPKNSIAIEDIDVAERSLFEDRQNKKLSDAQYDREIRALKNWRDILNKEAAAAEAAKRAKAAGK